MSRELELALIRRHVLLSRELMATHAPPASVARTLVFHPNDNQFSLRPRALEFYSVQGDDWAHGSRPAEFSFSVERGAFKR